jgi:hypothetical protein
MEKITQMTTRSPISLVSQIPATQDASLVQIVSVAFPRHMHMLTLIVHTQNETMAAGTVFAISYQSDITKVTEENLVVFTVKYQ